MLNTEQHLLEATPHGDTAQPRAERRRTPRSVAYFVAFDCLSGPEPLLAGFVRQTGGTDEAFDALVERWSWRMMDLRRSVEGGAPDACSAGDLLERAGFDGAALSLFYRPATDEEAAAFEDVSKYVGVMLKCVVVDSEGAWRAVRMRGPSIPGDLVKMPALLCAARLPLPVCPKLVFTKHQAPVETSLAAAIGQLPPAQRALAEQRLIDGAVLASGLPPPAAALPRWKVTMHPDGWSAILQQGSRNVILEDRGGELRVDLEIDGAMAAQPVALAAAPGRRKGDARGRGEAVLRLMHQLQTLEPT